MQFAVYTSHIEKLLFINLFGGDATEAKQNFTNAHVAILSQEVNPSALAAHRCLLLLTVSTTTTAAGTKHAEFPWLVIILGLERFIINKISDTGACNKP
jgi:hypothetical protein